MIKPLSSIRRFSLRTFFFLVAIVAICIAWQTALFRRQAGAAKRIEGAGGSVMYGFQETMTYNTNLPWARTREIEIDGRMRTVPYTVLTPVKRVRRKPPYTKIVNGVPCAFNVPGNDPVWRPFDFQHDWDITYVSLPLDRIDDSMIRFLNRLPKLKYLNVRVDAGYGPPSEDQFEHMDRVIASVPEVKVIGDYVDFPESMRP